MTKRERIAFQISEDDFKREIKQLKREIKQLKEDKANIYPKNIAELILITALRWLKGNFVDNPMKGLQGYDCDSIGKAEEAIKKVCRL